MTTLLLVHAFPVDASMWDTQLDDLKGAADVLAPSLPGFGGTPAAGDTLTMDAAADFLAGELDRAGTDRAVVCGVSMGGYIAFSMWRRHRDRVAALVLADTRAEADDDAGKEKRHALADRLVAEGNGFLADAPPPLLAEDADPALWERVKEIIRRQPADAIAAAARGMAARPDSRDILASIDVPTAVVVGSADMLTPPPMSEALAAGIPGSDLVILHGAGHLSNLESPKEFASVLEDIVGRAG